MHYLYNSESSKLSSQKQGGKFEPSLIREARKWPFAKPIRHGFRGELTFNWQFARLWGHFCSEICLLVPLLFDEGERKGGERNSSCEAATQNPAMSPQLLGRCRRRYPPLETLTPRALCTIAELNAVVRPIFGHGSRSPSPASQCPKVATAIMRPIISL